MKRRTFVKGGAATLGSFALLEIGFSRLLWAADTPYGPLGSPDVNGIALPPGFTSRVVATTGSTVGPTSYAWHPNPDGGATFGLEDGGWVYVSNDESGSGGGGASMVRFDADGALVDAGPILAGTSRNCAGGPTPWGTWLSCEEYSGGRVWECDPLGASAAVVRPAMGVFSHEAAAVDPVRQVVYLTEDQSDGLLYRFRPDVWGDLSSGVLEAMTEVGGQLGWSPVPDPSAASGSTRSQVSSAKRFDGGEGAWFDGSHLYFTSKGDNRVWRFDPSTDELVVIYDIATSADPLLRGVDNVTVSASGDVFVCEDGGNMEVVMLTPEGAVAPFLRVDGTGSELTGVAFDPSGTRMYVSSQRNPGTTYEITGPFRTSSEPPPGPTSIDATVTVTGTAKRRGVNATATIAVTDENSSPVANASVTGDWKVGGSVIGSAGGTSGSDGAVTLSNNRIAMNTGDILSFEVTTLGAPGRVWDPDLVPGTAVGSWEYVSGGGGNGGGGNNGGGKGGGKPR